MDWKYKHFHLERIFQAPSDTVLAAARAYITEALGWKITDNADGLTAEGSSAFHAALANFQVQSDQEGTRVHFELKVQRAGVGGFMLADIGGYYTIQMRKWLDGIQERLGTGSGPAG